MSELVDKWEPTGLILELENKEEVAESLEQAYSYLVEYSESDSLQGFSDDLEWAAGIILPAVSRCYRQENLDVVGIDVEEVSDVDGKKFAETFIENAKEYDYRETAKDLASYHNVDGEAELCQMFVEHYIQNHLSDSDG